MLEGSLTLRLIVPLVAVIALPTPAVVHVTTASGVAGWPVPARSWASAVRLEAVEAALQSGQAGGGAQPVASKADATEPSVGKEHPELEDTKAETCAMCHDDIAKGEVVHGPVASGDCTTCHEFSGKGDQTRVAFVAVGEKDRIAKLCTTCHDDVAQAAKQAHPHAPAAFGECLSCHDPHKSSGKRLLKTAGAGGCTSCHEGVGASLKLKSTHAPAVADCSICHDPHGTAQPALLRAATNDLCLGCHLWPRDSTSPPPTSLFGRDVDVTAQGMMAPDLVVELNASRTIGHPLLGHPVAGPKDPNDQNKPFSCVSCHDVHGSGARSLLKFMSEDSNEACVKCHK